MRTPAKIPSALGLLLVLLGGSGAASFASQDLDWWRTSVIYQIYPRSFMDSDGDGVGDLKGIADKLEYLRDAGVDAFWLSPFYSSPQVDFGYDITNFTDVDPLFGSLKDFDDLVAKAKKLGLKVIVDFVPNHTSYEHPWFRKSIDRIKPYDDYYVWHDGHLDAKGNRRPPNNWKSWFSGSAWTWNEKRGQYYYHAFTAGQPDLNYRNEKLHSEMKNVLTFWMDRGVDGFRVDAITHIYESEELLDQPRSGIPGAHPDDYHYYLQIYVNHLVEMYDLVRTWKELLDNYVSEHKTDGKILIMEANTTRAKSIRFYEVDTTPLNFMFINDLKERDKAIEYKSTIDTWLDMLPANQSSSWVTGSHDCHRAATRFGPKREDQISMLSAVLPGIMVIYNGDEIGMVNRHLSWEETIDPFGCNLDPKRYHLTSRDPERTPFQWNDGKNAGFSSSNKTWLPVHPNYKQLNLAKQKKDALSHYKVFQALTKLKKMEVMRKGTTELLLASEDVLAVVRRLDGEKSVILLINFNEEDVKIFNFTNFLNSTVKNFKIYTASVKSGLKPGTIVDANKIHLPAAASVILVEI